MQASQPNPYPHYSALLDGPELLFDAAAGVWVASRAAVIHAVLDHPDCHVRPGAEPVPQAIAGSAAGAVFGALMRMNEGAAHACPRGIAQPALAAIDAGQVASRVSQFAAMLDAQHGVHDGAGLTGWIYALPIYLVGSLLGVETAVLPLLAGEVGDFVRCLSPLSSAQQLHDANVAASALHARLGALASPRWAELDVANRIGLLAQTHDACAGLIGNSVVALLRDPPLQHHLRANRALAAALVRETARFDPPVQNTRRFVAQPVSIAGISLKAGDIILLLLAAASRDPQAYADPDVFLLDRPPGPLPGFGHGRHACPGQALALTIATAAIDYLLALPEPLEPATLAWRYKPSTNGRIPEFFTASPKEQP